jgi:hypothetical protein
MKINLKRELPVRFDSLNIGDCFIRERGFSEVNPTVYMRTTTYAGEINSVVISGNAAGTLTFTESSGMVYKVVPINPDIEFKIE